MDYRPNLSDLEEDYQDLEYALEEVMSNLRVAYDEIKNYREFTDLKELIEICIKTTQEELRGLTND